MLKRLLSPEVGIRVFAVWAGVLTFVALAKLLILTQTVELSSNANSNQAVVWLLVGLNVAFALGFGFSSYGLWMHHSWGRTLFLWTVVIWAGANMVTVFIPGAYPQNGVVQQLLTELRYAVTLVIPLFYLNRANVKSTFENRSQESTVKELNNV